MTFHVSRAGRALIGALAAVSLLAAGCGDDDDGGEDSADTTVAPETTEADQTTTTGAEEEGETIEVTAIDYGYQGLPAQIAAGTKLELTNSSTIEVHELVAFRIPDDEQRPAAELVALPEEESAALFGGGPPAAVLVAPPGATEDIEAVGDGTISEPGRYVVACFIPVGADPQAYLDAAGSGQEPDLGGGPPHTTEGMFAEVVVE